jgi:hypothetical protein
MFVNAGLMELQEIIWNLCWPIMLEEMLARDKQYSLLGPFVSDKQNKVL